MGIDQYSIPLWVIKNGIKNERGNVIEFKDHYFLFDIYKDLSRRQVIKKCSQVGVSVAMNLKVLNLAKYRNIGTIYTMPSDDDVSEFVNTKTDKIIQNNQIIKNELRTNNVQLKQIGNSFIHFKGTRSKTAAISTTTDLLVHDEIDRSDQNIVEQYRSRITFSRFKGIWLLSNPSVVGVGVDKDWKGSDRKEWFITCDKCKTEQYLTWQENVSEINKIFICKNCGKELTNKERRLGKWKPTNPGAEISGYHISQMMAPWLSAEELIKEKEDRGLEYFYNFILGEPYHPGETADFRTMITDSWTNKPLDAEPYFMGIDVGIEKHYVLGSSQGIFKIGVVKSRQELETIIDKYNPVVVMDAGPERTWAEEFKKKYPKLNLCFYKIDKTVAEMVKWGGRDDKKNWGYVWADRNRVISKVVEEFLMGRILMNIDREKLERYISHWETMTRMIEDTSLGTKRYVWQTSNGMDHWCHATVYYWIARQRASQADFLADITEKKEIIERTSEGFQMRNLKDLIEEQNE